MVQGVVAQRCVHDALDDTAGLDACGDVAKAFGVAGSPALADGVGLEVFGPELVAGQLIGAIFIARYGA